jgi:putative CocE/NonD family hydrolase
VVKLCDVDPDGRSLNVVDSVRRTAAEPGVPVDVEVDMGSTAWRFPSGHRIRLHVCGSNFPRFDANPSTGEPPGTAQQFEPAEHRVHWGEGARMLLLPASP